MNLRSESGATVQVSGKMSEQGDRNTSKSTINNNQQGKGTAGTCSEITIKEFLDFLKTAYQVQDNVEGILQSEGMADVVDWIKLKEESLVKPREIAVQTSEHKMKRDESKTRPESLDIDNADLKRKLSEVLSEGLLDSVLPYLVPSTGSTCLRRHTSSKHEKLVTAIANSDEKLGRRKSTDSLSKCVPTKSESDVEIHVCDEVKNIRKDFTCNQKLLVEQMGYFAEVTAGQKLEDMDISVHCDIGIFEWLMRWVKRDNLLEGDRPRLDINCAVPVLVSAAFLQMEPLLNECLLFCHENMNEILKSSTSLSCLNDVVVTKLAALYTNSEVEAIKDRKDKIQSRLFGKLIQSLCEVEPEALRGHYSTLGKIYKCKYCHQLVSALIEDSLSCVPSCTSVELDGAIVSNHVRDQNWNLTEHVTAAQTNLKTWRKVYWRLWGDAHFLYCVTCKRHFPARQIGWCRFHPDPPQFFTLDAQRTPLPVGRYPCCGERAYRFQILDDYCGCKFKDHDICTKEARDASVLAMLETYRNIIEEIPPELIFPERLTRLIAKDPSSEDGTLDCKEIMWWDGVEVMPPRPKLGLLGAFDDSEDADNEAEIPLEEDETGTEGEEVSSNSSNSSSSDSIRSEESAPTRSLKKAASKKKKIKKAGCRLWQLKLSARSNQDLQRANEENVLKDMATVLVRKTTSNNEHHHSSRHSKTWSRHVTPLAGIWVRLESEWRDANSAGVPPRMRHTNASRPKHKQRLS